MMMMIYRIAGYSVKAKTFFEQMIRYLLTMVLVGTL